MTKKNLMEYRAIVREIRQLKEELEIIQARVESVSSQPTDRPSFRSTERDKIGRAIAEAEELKERLLVKLAEQSQLQNEIENEISKLDPLERVLVRYRYIYGLRWEEVSSQMNYSISAIYTLHRQALEKLRQINEIAE